MAEMRNEPVRTQTSAVEPQPRGHSLALKDRRHLAVTGVTRIISCDETAAVLETPLGNLTIGGQELQVSELSVQSGQVQLSGKIEYMQYAENRQSNGGLLARLFR
ncbi:sporulation protein YabP [Subdoligranulum variabile]|nr:sporulation protein YabP [Subdoligranulum variabile]UWP67996.1 sporulation protein YabP [Subdoligranulum variabile]